MDVDWFDGDSVCAYILSAPRLDLSSLGKAMNDAREQFAQLPAMSDEDQRAWLMREAKKLPMPGFTEDQVKATRAIVQEVARHIKEVYERGLEHWKVMMEFLSSHAGSGELDRETREAAELGLDSIGMLETCLGLY